MLNTAVTHIISDFYDSHGIYTLLSPLSNCWIFSRLYLTSQCIDVLAIV